MAWRFSGRRHERSSLHCRARCNDSLSNSARLLDELVAGTTMDLKQNASDAPDTYATFVDLYAYCYLVASVVGLVCIRIFGYTDPKAEKLAEETGDRIPIDQYSARCRRGRGARIGSYMPLEDLAGSPSFIGVPSAPCARVPPQPNERALLAAVAQRAEGFYRVREETDAADRLERASPHCGC